jgi:hypothetical protein
MHVMAGSIPGAGMFAPQAPGMVHLQRASQGSPLSIASSGVSFVRPPLTEGMICLIFYLSVNK